MPPVNTMVEDDAAAVDANDAADTVFQQFSTSVAATDDDAAVDAAADDGAAVDAVLLQCIISAATSVAASVLMQLYLVKPLAASEAMA